MLARILIAAIPVTAMLVIEGVLSRRKRRRGISPRQIESDQTRRDVASTGSDVDAYPPSEYPSTEGRPEGVAMSGASCEAGVLRGVSCRVEPDRTRRWRQDDRYFQTLHQAAQTGSLSAMNKLGEFALVRRNFVEAFYWKLMLEMRHGRPSGLPAKAVCRVWQDVGCPKPTADESGSFTENQSKLAMAVLDLWSGRHVHTPKETIRQMVEEGDKDALLCAKRFGIRQTRS